MGICKFQDIWKTLFSWVLPVPENAHKAKCKYCPGKIIDIKCGSQALKRHEACSIHMKAVTSVAGSNIVAQMQAGTSVEEGKLKVVLLHCLKLVLDGHSQRSSDCCSRSRNFYSKLFPDSKYADINCGRTKAGYIIKFALGSYCKELIISEMADKPFAIHVDESMYHSKVRLEFWVIHFVKQILRVRYLTTIELKTNFDVSAFLTSDSSLKSLVWFLSGKQIKRWTESSKKQEKNSPKQRLHLFKLKNANKNWKR